MSIVINPLTGQAEDVPDFLSEFNTLPTDIAVVSATALIDTALRIPFGRSQRFYFQYGLFFTTSATADFNFRLALPAAAQVWRNRRSTIAPDALSTLVTGFETANNGTSNNTVLCASGTHGYTAGEGIFVAPDQAGELIIQFAQNTTNAGATTLQAGSYIAYKQY